MKPIPLLAFAAVLAAASPLVSSAKVERVVEKTFTVSPDARINVETQGGNIRVSTGAGNEIKVTAREYFRTSSESEADEVARQLKLEIRQSGNEVTAYSKYEGSRGSFFWNSNTPVSVSFEVVVPERSAAKLRTSGGNIEVGDLAGEVDGKTSGGNITVGRIDGPVDLHTSGGNIVIREALRTLKANTSGGDIRVDRVTGEARLSTSGGNIRIASARGAVDAETSGGDVSATFSERPTHDSELRTSGGNVTARINSGASLHLDASTSGGSVKVSGVDVKVQGGGIGKSKLVGDIGGGGPTLTLRTSGGDVRVSTD